MKIDKIQKQLEHFIVTNPAPENMNQLFWTINRDGANDVLVSTNEAMSLIEMHGVYSTSKEGMFIGVLKADHLHPTMVISYNVKDGHYTVHAVYRLYMSDKSQLGVLTPFELDDTLNNYIGALYDESIVKGKFCAMVLIGMVGGYLGVSRKDDHTNIGMPGGKSEDNGETWQECAIRETLEETGFTVELTDIPPFVAQGLHRTCVTYIANITGIPPKEIPEHETGVVSIYPKQAFLDGFSGVYNEKMFEYFNL